MSDTNSESRKPAPEKSFSEKATERAALAIIGMVAGTIALGFIGAILGGPPGAVIGGKIGAAMGGAGTGAC